MDDVRAQVRAIEVTRNLVIAEVSVGRRAVRVALTSEGRLVVNEIIGHHGSRRLTTEQLEATG